MKTLAVFAALAVAQFLCPTPLSATRITIRQNQQLVPLSKADKQGILDTHNTLRARIARGDVQNQPSAADMMLMEWDDRLSNKAASWVVKCVSGNDPSANLNGQNWAGAKSLNLSFHVTKWFDEVKAYTYNDKGGRCTTDTIEVCGHYTQLIWARTLRVGCAAATCPNFERVLLCNYAPAGNLDTRPAYVSGPPASQCPAEYGYTQGSLGVCLRKDQCSDQCRCVARCLNGGTLDPVGCKCACTPDFVGARCEIPCEDPESLRESCKEANACDSFAEHCPKTCKLCTAVTELRDKDLVNSDGILARVPNAK